MHYPFIILTSSKGGPVLLPVHEITFVATANDEAGHHHSSIVTSHAGCGTAVRETCADILAKIMRAQGGSPEPTETELDEVFRRLNALSADKPAHSEGDG